MANFGLTDLRLVTPRDGWPNDKAHAAAAGAAFVVEQATVYDSVEHAIGELNFVLATTARPREMVKAVLSPESAGRELRRRAETAPSAPAYCSGPNEAASTTIPSHSPMRFSTAPVSPGFASLSLPQAVLLFGYEWLKAESAAPPLGRATEFDGPATEGIAFPDTRPATRAELLGLFDHLEGELDRTGFLYPPEKRPSMVRAIRNMFHRMAATEQDVRTWRGIVASLSGHRPRGGKKLS